MAAVRERFLLTNIIEVGAVPKDTTGAAVATDWVNLANASGAIFLIAKGAWAGGTPAVTLAQATSAAGAGSKAVSFQEAFTKTALATSGKWVKTVVASDTFNLTAVANIFTAVEVQAEALDRDNGFNFLQLGIASPGANADLITVLVVLYGARNQGDPAVILDDGKV